MLILGSYGFRTEINRAALDKLLPEKSGKMLIIPLGCMFGLDTAAREKIGAQELSFRAEDIFIFDESRPADFTCQNYRYIAVLGGNTFQLLHGVRKYRLDTFIREQVAAGAVYLGFSAGAYLACPNIEYVQNFDENNDITDGDFSGLGLTDKYVLCHFDSRGTAEIMACRRYIGMEPELLTIRDSDYIVL